VFFKLQIEKLHPAPPFVLEWEQMVWKTNSCESLHCLF